jgi:CHAT domain-containing protein
MRRWVTVMLLASLNLLTRSPETVVAVAPPARLTAAQREQLALCDRWLRRADARYAAGEIDEAITALKKGLALERAVFGMLRAATLPLLTGLARLQEQQEQFVEALAARQEHWRTLREYQGEADWQVQDALLDIEDCRLLARLEGKQRQRLRQAEQWNNRVVRLWQEGKSHEALGLAQKALAARREILGEKHRLTAQSWLNLGAQQQALQRQEEAERCYLQALQIRQKLYPPVRYPQGHPDLAGSINNLGFLHQAEGEYGKAEPLLARALKMNEASAAALAESAPEATALNYLASLPATRDAYLSTTRRLPKRDAYLAVWQSKAALSRVYEARHLAVLAGLGSPKVKSLWEQLVALRRQRERLLLAPLAANSRTRDDRLKQIDESIGKLQEELRPLLPAVPRAEKLARSKPEELQKALPPGVVLIDLLRYTFIEQDAKVRGEKGEKRTLCYVAFVVTRDRIRRVELGPAKAIEEAVADWRGAVTAWKPGRREATRQAARVRELLWNKVETHLPADTSLVYLAPDADLSRVPWAALPGRKPGRVLLEEMALAVVPHGVFLLDRLTAAREKPKGKAALLALGGVHYDRKPSKETNSRAANHVVGSDKLTWDFLPGSAQELEQVRKLAGTMRVASLSGTGASRSAVLEALPGAHYAHLATHGFFASREFRSVLQLDEKLFGRGWRGERAGAGSRSPLVLSGLVLAGANLAETADRGILSADAIVSLPLDKMYLAVLSACETGLGDVAGGEGVFGLQRAFHLAGTRNVVASLWKVDDAATTALMVLFYRHLQEEKRPAIEALRRAQLSLYYHPEAVKEWAQGKRGPNVKKSFKGSAVVPPPAVKGRAPSHWWAAFVLSGPGN